MKYHFNYSFLKRWMQANADITDRQVLYAMGTTSNAGLDSWEKMKTPIPTIQLLRFCNVFQVPISAFIVDADADYSQGIDQFDYVQPDVNDQFEPDGGYIPKNERRPLGTRALRDPTDVELIKSTVPGLVKESKSTHNDNNTIHQNHNEGNNIQQHINKAQAVVGNITDTSRGENDSALASRLLDIIAEQQKQITNLSQQVGELAGQVVKLSSECMSTNVGNSMNACMVAEDSPRHRQ